MITISKFVDDYYSNKKSRNTYKSSIIRFAEYISSIKRGKKTNKNELDVYENVMLDYLKSNANFANDIEKYIVYLESGEIPPKTINICIVALKQYLEHNDIEFSAKALRSLKHKLPKNNASTIERDLDIEILRKILAHMDIKGKALVTFLIGTGMRIGEAVKIMVDELMLDEQPASITIRSNKISGRPRYVFINKEAKEVLMEWLKVREKYLQSAVNRNKQLVANGYSGAKSPNDNRVFPFSTDVAGKMWINAVTNVGIYSKDRITNRSQTHLHQLRKFFRSQMGLGNCPRDIIEALMGHDEYLDIVYRRYTKQQVAEYYLKAEPHLYINASEDIEGIRQEFSFRQEATEDMVKKFAIENAEQRGKFNKQLSEKEEQIKNLATMHDTLQLTMEATIEKAVRERMDAYQKTMETPINESMMMQMIKESNENFLAHLDRIEKEKDTLKQELEELKARKDK
jgi:integrase